MQLLPLINRIFSKAIGSTSKFLLVTWGGLQNRGKIWESDTCPFPINSAKASVWKKYT